MVFAVYYMHIGNESLLSLCICVELCCVAEVLSIYDVKHCGMDYLNCRFV